MMDLHCHIDLYPNYTSIIEDAHKQGLYVLSVTTTPKAWVKTNSLTKNYPRFNTSLGLHPQLAHLRETELELFDKLFDNAKYIGEIGLDGSKEYRQHMDVQLRVFRHILAKCRQVGDKILTIHSRSASKEVISELKHFGNVGNVILHWYTGSKRDLDEALNLNAWFSIGPAMIDSANGQKIINWLPKNKILLETDGPFAKYKGEIVKPTDVFVVIKYLSELWSIGISEVEAILRQNLRDLVSIN